MTYRQGEVVKLQTFLLIVCSSKTKVQIIIQPYTDYFILKQHQQRLHYLDNRTLQSGISNLTLIRWFVKGKK